MGSLILTHREGKGVRITNLINQTTIDTFVTGIRKSPDKNRGEVDLLIGTEYLTGKPTLVSGEPLKLAEQLTVDLLQEFISRDMIYILWTTIK